ncbi:hypothetical protein MSTHC_2009 [Methanosarcina thermophila CHTI-55]|nr:hypothetical protein MSTHC_2009 [Methanosarcina thermophila CHTI-55]
MQNIALLEGDVWGHRKDINEYSEVSQHVFDRIQELRDEGLSDEETIERLVKETRLSPDFVSFIMSN